nr:immunoglobulin heavy chain junction region [Macaca mulatta]
CASGPPNEYCSGIFCFTYSGFHSW